jgi:peptidoglycan-associated lipoprotein
LKPIIIEKGTYEFPEVRYDYNSAALQVNNEVNSKDSLNYLYDLMIKNPTLIIQLESHTDARGDDKYNQDLAQRRAESCVEYLVKEKGIPVDRLKALGKGESEPRTLERDFGQFKKGTVMTEAFINALPNKEEQELAHQLNRRTTFRILATNYQPKN